MLVTVRASWPWAVDSIPSWVDVTALLLFYAYPTTHALVYGLKERFLRDQIQTLFKNYLVKRQWKQEARIASKLYHVRGARGGELRREGQKARQTQTDRQTDRERKKERERERKRKREKERERERKNVYGQKEKEREKEIKNERGVDSGTSSLIDWAATNGGSLGFSHPNFPVYSYISLSVYSYICLLSK